MTLAQAACRHDTLATLAQAACRHDTLAIPVREACGHGTLAIPVLAILRRRDLTSAAYEASILVKDAN
jgi:hypothetical protein